MLYPSLCSSNLLSVLPRQNHHFYPRTRSLLFCSLITHSRAVLGASFDYTSMYVGLSAGFLYAKANIHAPDSVRDVERVVVYQRSQHSLQPSHSCSHSHSHPTASTLTLTSQRDLPAKVQHVNCIGKPRSIIIYACGVRRNTKVPSDM